MKRVVVALLVTFAGCGKADEAIKEMEAIKTDACACTDAACIADKKITDRIDAWKVDHKGTKGSTSQRDRAKTLLDEAAACAKKAAEGAAPPKEEETVEEEKVEEEKVDPPKDAGAVTRDAP